MTAAEGLCTECGSPLDLAGWDGLCGNCADAKDAEGEL